MRMMLMAMLVRMRMRMRAAQVHASTRGTGGVRHGRLHVQVVPSRMLATPAGDARSAMATATAAACAIGWFLA